MSKNIIPPLTMFCYSPKQPNFNKQPLGEINASFYDNYNTRTNNVPVSSLILNTTINSEFNKNIYSQYLNRSSMLYLTNTNGYLTNPICNFLSKTFLLKTNINTGKYSFSDLSFLYVYDSNNYYGSLIITNANDYNNFINHNSSLIDGEYNFNVIYADGFYSYLTNNNNINYYQINVIISNGIRTITFPPDPSGQYNPDIDYSIYNFVNILYFNRINSDFNNYDIPINTYNTSCVIYENENLSINIGNLLTNYTITNNLIESENSDGFEFQAFSIFSDSPLVKTGTILGLKSITNASISSVGAVIRNSSTSYGIILYASESFEYLNNKGVKTYPYKQTYDSNSGLYTIAVPRVPSDYISPITIVMPNKTIGDITTYGTFYFEKLNNSVIFDKNITKQDYTLSTLFLYGDYNFGERPNLPLGPLGPSIGNVNVYKLSLQNLSNTNVNNSNLNISIYIYSFNDSGNKLVGASVDDFQLTNNGDITSDIVITQNVISNSINYNDAYSCTLFSENNINKVQVNQIIN